MLVTWPYGDNYSYLEAGYEVNGVAAYSYVPGVELVGSHWQASVPLTTTNQPAFLPAEQLVRRIQRRPQQPLRREPPVRAAIYGRS